MAKRKKRKVPVLKLERKSWYGKVPKSRVGRKLEEVAFMPHHDPPERKLIGGCVFTKHGMYLTKFTANLERKKLQKKGYRTRLYKMKPYGAYLIYKYKAS